MAKKQCLRNITKVCGVPGYLRKILDDYLDNRILLYDADEGVQRYAVLSAVPQGSVLGPILWNAM